MMFMPFVIFAVCAALLVYARRWRGTGVLR